MMPLPHRDGERIVDPKGPPMSDSLLHRSLAANAIFSASCGAALIGASARLSDVLELPAWLLATIGVALIPFAGLVALISRNPDATAVRVVIGADAAWVVAALVLITGFGSAMATTSIVALSVVSLAVADLAVLQYIGLRRATSLR
jgi:hypothetical protein